MNYYQELIESYLSTKSILELTEILLLESIGTITQDSIVGNDAQSRVASLIGAMASYQSSTQSNPVILQYNGNEWKVYYTKSKEIGLIADRNYNLSKNPQSAYHLFDKGAAGSEQEPQGGEVAQDQAGGMQVSDMQQRWDPAEVSKLTGAEAVIKWAESSRPLSKAVKNTVAWNYLREVIKSEGVDLATEELDVEIENQLRSVVEGTLAKQALGAYSSAFSGGFNRGSIARKIYENKTIRVENGAYTLKDVPPNEVIIENSNRIVKDVLDKVSKAIRNRDGQLDPSECESIKKSIVPMGRGLLYIKDTASNTGVVINDNRNKSRKIINSLLKSVNCGVSGRDSGGARQIRGDFFEAVQKLVIDTVNCLHARSTGTPIQDCSKNLLSSFETRFKEKKDTLIAALKAYEKVEDTGMQMDDEGSAEGIVLSMLEKLYGDAISKNVFKAVISMAAINYNKRKPVKVINIAKDTKFGKKGDLLELWDTSEAIATAIGINPKLEAGVRDKVIKSLLDKGHIRIYSVDDLRKIDPKSEHPGVKGDKTYYGLDVSLKAYITTEEGIGLGSVSENTLRAIFLGSECKDGDKVCVENVEEIQLLRKGMAEFFEEDWITDDNSQRYKNVSRLQKSITALESKIDNMPLRATIQSVMNPGKQIKKEPFKEYCESLLGLMEKKSTFGERQQSGVAKRLADYIERAKKKNKSEDVMEKQMKAIVKNYLAGVLLENNMKNKDTRQAAIDHMVMSDFAAAGSRNAQTVISVAGIVDRFNLSVKQNDLIRGLKSVMKNEKDYDIVINNDKNEITYSKDGVAIYVASISSSSTGVRRRDSLVTQDVLLEHSQL